MPPGRDHASQGEREHSMKLNKLSLVASLALTGVMGLGISGFAADTNAPANSLATEKITAMHERMEKEAKELGLTAEQKEKIKEVLHKYLGGVHSIHQNAELKAEQKVAKIKAIRAQISDEFKKILTPEQFAKWKAKEGETLQPQLGLERIASLIDSLNLTDDQRDKLSSLHQEQMEKLRDLRDDKSLSLSKKIEKLQDIRKEVDPKLKEVLDDEQYQKWKTGVDKWVSQLKERAKQME
jgi:Spy/CpxP family protein refolding chaperone